MKRPKKPSEFKNFQKEKTVEEQAEDRLLLMKYKDLKIACVSRGMPFEDVVKLDHNGLASFFIKNYERTEDPKLLVDYDNWIAQQLESRGYKKGDAMLSPCLRLGYSGNLEEIKGNIQDPEKKKVVRVETDIKPRREKNEDTGVVKGTKKDMTYTLARKGEPIETIIDKVMKAFPEAQVKSIRIWAKRALKPQEDE